MSSDAEEDATFNHASSSMIPDTKQENRFCVVDFGRCMNFPTPFSAFVLTLFAVGNCIVREIQAQKIVNGR